MTEGEALKRLMKMFYMDDGGILYSYIEFTTINQIDPELNKFLLDGNYIEQPTEQK